MKTNENVRQLGTEGPGAGTWSLSVSLPGLMFVGKKILTMARKERKTTKEQRQGIQRTR